MSDDVKPYTDEELEAECDFARRVMAHDSLMVGSVSWHVTKSCLRYQATIEEDRRKLALAVEALTHISNYCEFGSVSKSCADEALVALTTTGK